jgi:hypothetical protein
VVYLLLVGVAQLLAFLAGILVIRTMPKIDYAAYAAAVAAISAAGVIADSGIGATLMSRMAGTIAGSSDRSGLMRAALIARRRVSVLILAAISVALVVVFTGLHLPPLITAAAVVLVAVIVSNSLVRTLYVVDLQLQRRFIPIVGADAAAAAFRLALVGLAAALTLDTGLVTIAYLAIFLLASLLQTAIARRFSGFRTASAGDPVPHTAVFRAAFRTTAPWTVLMIAGEQLINLLLTAYGNAAAIAEISALTRYSLVFGLVVSVIGNIVTAAIAQTAPDRYSLGSVFRRTAAGGLVISVAYVAGVWLCRGPLLDLLGPGYQHLDGVFLVLAIASAVQFFGTYVLGAMTHARGWLRGSWTFGPLLALWLVFVVLLQPRDSLSAALAFLALQVPTLLAQVVRVGLGLRGGRAVA